MNSDTKHDTNHDQNCQHLRAKLTMEKDQAHITTPPSPPLKASLPLSIPTDTPNGVCTCSKVLSICTSRALAILIISHLYRTIMLGNQTATIVHVVARCTWIYAILKMIGKTELCTEPEARYSTQYYIICSSSM